MLVWLGTYSLDDARLSQINLFSESNNRYRLGTSMLDPSLRLFLRPFLVIVESIAFISSNRLESRSSITFISVLFITSVSAISRSARLMS